MKKAGILLHRFWNQLTTQGLIMTLWAGADTIIRNVTGHPIRKLSEITPQLFVGGQPAMSFWDDLLSWGVLGVVNMRGEYDYAKQVNALGLPLELLHLPTIDTEAPTLDNLKKGVAFIQQHVQAGNGVYIHCWEGLGRGPTMAAAYLVSTGLSPNQAWDKIRETRPFIRPTDAQQQQLEAFARHHQDAQEPIAASQPKVTV